MNKKRNSSEETKMRRGNIDKLIAELCPDGVGTRFCKGNNHARRKQVVLKNLGSFFERFFGLT